MCVYRTWKPSRHKLIWVAMALYTTREKVPISTCSGPVLGYLKVVFLVLDINTGLVLRLVDHSLGLTLEKHWKVEILANTAYYTKKDFTRCRERYKLHCHQTIWNGQQFINTHTRPGYRTKQKETRPQWHGCNSFWDFSLPMYSRVCLDFAF
jgi:hypothetical protein